MKPAIEPKKKIVAVPLQIKPVPRATGVRGRKVSTRTFAIALDVFRTNDSYGTIAERHGVRRQYPSEIAQKMRESGWKLPSRTNTEK